MRAGFACIYAGQSYIGLQISPQKMNGCFDSIWLPQFHTLLPSQVMLTSSAFINGPDKGIYVVYSLECNAARTPLCLVAQKVTQCETENDDQKRLKQLFYFYSDIVGLRWGSCQKIFQTFTSPTP